MEPSSNSTYSPPPINGEPSSIKTAIYYGGMALISSIGLAALYGYNVCDLPSSPSQLTYNCNNSLELSTFSNVLLPVIAVTAGSKAVNAFKNIFS